MRPSLRALAAGSTALAVLGAAGAVAAGPVAAGPAAGPPTLTCFAEVPGVTARGVPATFHYEDGRATTEKRGPDTLGYQPRDIAYPHPATGGLAGTSGRAARVTSYWFTLSGAQLREVMEVDRRDTQGRLVSSEYHSRVLRKHWAGARQISIGMDRDRMYVLTNGDQLLRYDLHGKDGDTRVRFEQVVGTGFGTIGTLEYSRTLTALGLRTDIFLATDADTGELLELAIPKDDPASYTRTVLGTGWYDMRTAGRRASCVSDKGRSYGAIVGTDISGALRLWTDRDPGDGNGSDIQPWGVLKPAWKPMPYND